ncbi:hypothetical protein BKA65DRAFT_513347 [Rhexocercosporidium sp. MPI-PUGE-AT-0058]|nr:hypothetical protein BKA65DRAFT_513347 [Rhexocercosporidium sp. MPI-PUGE-AT-0058]
MASLSFIPRLYSALLFLKLVLRSRQICLALSVLARSISTFHSACVNVAVTNKPDPFKISTISHNNMARNNIAIYSPLPKMVSSLGVLLHISRNLKTPDYCKLRLTCKHVEAQLLNAFAGEFFQKKQFMFTEFSLQALVDISKSRFTTTLKHVIFGLEQPQRTPPLSLPKQNWSPVVIKQNRQLMAWVDHSSFLNSGQNVEMLAEAFSALPYLETVGLRDFNSSSRHRDHPYFYWNSYGAPTYFKDTGSPMLSPRNRHKYGTATALGHLMFVYRAFQDILRGAGKASIHLKDFEVILRTCALSDRAFNIPKYLEPTIGPVLANLRTLFLDLSSEDPYILVETQNGVTECPSYSLMKFLSHTVNLEHLRLNFESYHNTESILSWLSRSPPTTSNPTAAASPLAEPQPVGLNSLKQLDIGMITVEPKVILAIIRKHRANLRVISLHKVTFIHTADVSADERVNLWAKLFEDLSKLGLKLDAINMSLLSQQQPGRLHKRYVSFKETREGHTKRWAGNDTQSGLRDFQAQVTIDNLDQDTPQPSDESSQEHSDDSMDDQDHEDDEDEEDDEDDEDEEDDEDDE